MIKDLYLSFGDLFRHFVSPDGRGGYYMQTSQWTEVRFTQLFFIQLIAGMFAAVLFHQFFNGKGMPSIYNTRKFWFKIMLLVFLANFLVVLIFFWSNTWKINNHFYCTAFANGVFGLSSISTIGLIPCYIFFL